MIAVNQTWEIRFQLYYTWLLSIVLGSFLIHTGFPLTYADDTTDDL